MAGAVDALSAAAVACAVPAPKTQALSFLDQLPPSDANKDLARNVPLPVTNTPSSPASCSVSSATRGAFFSFSLPSDEAVDFLGFFSALGLASLFFLGAGLGLGLGFAATGAALGCNNSAFFSLNSCSDKIPSSNKALASRRAWTVSASIVPRRVGWRFGQQSFPGWCEPTGVVRRLGRSWTAKYDAQNVWQRADRTRKTCALQEPSGASVPGNVN